MDSILKKHYRSV